MEKPSSIEIEDGKIVDNRTINTITLPSDPTYDVPPETLASESETVNVDKITKAIIHWPPGTNALVDVHIMFKNDVILPTGEGRWLNKDDATIPYNMNTKIDRKGPIKVEWRNRDTAHTHRVSVDILYTERRS